MCLWNLAEILPVYTIYGKDRCDNRRGGGVLVAINTIYNKPPIQKQLFCLEVQNAEYIVMELFRLDSSKFASGIKI
jgi:hypothetical protein